MKPLNELLHYCLTETFGNVGITNQGQPIKISHRPDWYFRKGRLKAEVLVYGETYQVSCPFCSDTRHRLWINHCWGSRDERTNDDMLHLVRCFNENCVNSREKQKTLHAMVFPRGVHARSMTVRTKPVKSTAPMPTVPVRLPPHTALTELPANHPAISYLVKRRFDPKALSSLWGVRFCPENHSVRPHFAVGRIVVPVYTIKKSLFAGQDAVPKRVLAGWQARTLRPNSPKGVPKYLTAAGMKKSQLLYGLPQAVNSEGPIIVVEGVTDVWRVGLGAVGLFGKSISPAQVKLLLRCFAGRPIVVLLDADAAEDARRACRQIRSSRLAASDEAAVVVARLPAGRKDPGDCTHKEILKAVNKAVS